MNKIFVGNFSFSVDDAKLKEHFGSIGNVVGAKVMTEGEGGRSRGFGFVEFSSEGEAKKAIEELDGTVWDGRVLKVSEDRSGQRGDHSRDSRPQHHDREGGHGHRDGGGRDGGGHREGGYREGGYREGGGYGGQREGGHRDRDRDGGGYGQNNSGGPTGYFRAQPLDLGFRRKKKVDPFIEDPSVVIDYKDPKLLTRFMSERGRILPRRMTGLTSQNQRLITRAIKRAQHLGLLPYLSQ